MFVFFRRKFFNNIEKKDFVFYAISASCITLLLLLPIAITAGLSIGGWRSWDNTLARVDKVRGTVRFQ